MIYNVGDVVFAKPDADRIKPKTDITFVGDMVKCLGKKGKITNRVYIREDNEYRYEINFGYPMKWFWVEEWLYPFEEEKEIKIEDTEFDKLFM